MRSPTSTASSAVARAAASSRTKPDRNATRSVDMVTARYSSVTAPITSACGLPRADSWGGRHPPPPVREVAADPGEQPPLPLCGRLGVQSDQDGEDRDERQRDAD